MLGLEDESTALIDDHECAVFRVQPYAQLGLNALNRYLARADNGFLPLPFRVVWEVVQAFEIGRQQAQPGTRVSCLAAGLIRDGAKTHGMSSMMATAPTTSSPTAKS